MGLADDFRDLLGRRTDEKELQRFLESHPEVLTEWLGIARDEAKLVAKADLHRFQTDFAVGRWFPTTGRWEWALIELERADHQLFTQRGDPTAALTHALRQVTDWRDWIEQNLHYARTILPDITPRCSVIVLIGRRASLSDDSKGRLAMMMAACPGLHVRTYDALRDVCERIDKGE